MKEIFQHRQFAELCKTGLILGKYSGRKKKERKKERKKLNYLVSYFRNIVCMIKGLKLGTYAEANMGAQDVLQYLPPTQPM